MFGQSAAATAGPTNGAAAALASAAVGKNAHTDQKKVEYVEATNIPTQKKALPKNGSAPKTSQETIPKIALPKPIVVVEEPEEEKKDSAAAAAVDADDDEEDWI